MLRAMFRIAFIAAIAIAAPAFAVEPFAPVNLTVDVTTLPQNEQRVLGKLVEASRLMDTLFLRQDWAGNEPLLLSLVQSKSPQLGAFLTNKGPWNRLDHNK